MASQGIGIGLAEPEPITTHPRGVKGLFETNAVPAVIVPTLALIVVALVAKLLDIPIAAVVAEVAALAGLSVGGPMAYRSVWSKRTHDRDLHVAQREGMSAGIDRQLEHRRELDQERAARWEEWEEVAGIDHSVPAIGDIEGWG